MWEVCHFESLRLLCEFISSKFIGKKCAVIHQNLSGRNWSFHSIITRDTRHASCQNMGNLLQFILYLSGDHLLSLGYGKFVCW